MTTKLAHPNQYHQRRFQAPVCGFGYAKYENLIEL